GTTATTGRGGRARGRAQPARPRRRSPAAPARPGAPASVGARLLPSSVAGSVAGQLGEVPCRRGVRALDTRRDPSLVAVTQLRQVWRAPVRPRGKDAYPYVGGQRRHLLVESVPAGGADG